MENSNEKPKCCNQLGGHITEPVLEEEKKLFKNHLGKPCGCGCDGFNKYCDTHHCSEECKNYNNFNGTYNSLDTQESMEWESSWKAFADSAREFHEFLKVFEKHIKCFFPSQIKQAEERVIKELVTKINQFKKPILDKIDAEDNKYWKANRNNDIGYNKCIQDIIFHLQSELKAIEEE